MTSVIQRYPLRVRGVSISLLAVRSVQQCLNVRVTGLAAEMTYYALLSLLPLTGAIGASLGFLERLAGPEEALEAEAAIIRGLHAVFSTEATADVIAPLVQGLLRQERTGFALFAVVVATTILSLVVVGPLLGGGRAVANWLGFGGAFESAWAVARWPAVFAVAAAFLASLYHVGPNVKNTWAGSVPGAIFGMTALVLVAAGFRLYIQATGLQNPEIDNADDAVVVALQVIGALLAALLWLWLSSMAVLAGGVVNAEWSHIRRALPVQPLSLRHSRTRRIRMRGGQ